MAIIENPSVSPSGQRDMAGELASVTALRPRENGGSFLPVDQTADVYPILPPLEEFDTEVDTTTRQHLGIYRYDGAGTVWRERWQMSNGITHLVTMGEPEHRHSDYAVLNETPWCTQNDGYNEEVAVATQLALGLPFVLVGPEEDAEISLAESAHNSHAILDVAQRIGYFDGSQIMLYGFSRGAEKALADAAYAEMHDRELIYAHVVDPYGAAPIEASLEQLAEVIDVAVNEVTTAVQAVVNLALDPGKLWRYRKSIDPTLRGLKQIHRTGKAVLSGEAAQLAHYFPEDGQATVTIFGKENGRRRRIFESILGDLPGVEFTGLRKGHFVNLHETVIGKTGNRFAGLAEQLGAGVEPEDIDYSLVHKKLAS